MRHSVALFFIPLCFGAAYDLNRSVLPKSPSEVILANGSVAPPTLVLDRRCTEELCRPVLINRGKTPFRVKEVVLFHITHSLPESTRLYGESFQMLSQTGGTLGAPVDLGYSEPNHYKLPQPAGVHALSGMMTVTPPQGETRLLAFTSCKRFIGRFYLRPNRITVAVDTEGLQINPGEAWRLEEFLFDSDPNREAMLARLAGQISRNHPPLRTPAPPTGWCSWYCFGPRVTAQDVTGNLQAIRSKAPSLRYVQIDDGYQPAMGDWLETGKAFGGDVQGVLKQIRQNGYEPAIWVAPFIAEAGSHLFQQHPDWFIKGDDGKPLPSNQVTFGGWRHGPWYALDGTNPAVQKHLKSTFRTMREQWGVTYFKLDANFWGAMHGGHFSDPNATRIEAYRRGMEAILQGSGDSFILGCNHPIWPSFGLIHGSRSSADISRKWATIEKVARQNLNRNWQNGKLWWNDPDAIVLAGDLPLNEFLFHATATYATGGMVLSGDDLATIPDDRLALLKKMLPPPAKAARFMDESLEAGWIEDRMLAVFNWTDSPKKISVPLKRGASFSDFWTGEDLGSRMSDLQLDMPARSARLLVAR